MTEPSRLSTIDLAIFDELNQTLLCAKILWDRLAEDEARPASITRFVDRLEWLVMNHFLYVANGQPFDRTAIECGFVEATPYWFGLTDTGFLAWLRHAERWQQEAIGVRLLDANRG